MSAIAVINHKGGVAKTTTSINVGAHWANLGQKVLLVDLDPQGSATRSVFNDREFEFTIHDVMLGRVSAEKAILQSEVFGFDMIPSEILLSGIDVELSAHFGRERILKRQLDKVARKYDSILIDCSPSLGLLTVNALLCSKDIIIPICPEYFSIQGIELILETLKNIRSGLGHSINVRGIVITRYRNRKVINEVIENVRQTFGIPIYESFVPDNISVEEAHHRHLPVFKYDPKCKGAQAYGNLAKEILG